VRDGADLFGGAAVERGSGNFEDGEVEVDLAAMVDFVFGHEAEPLPGGDGSVAGSGAFSLKVGVGEAGKDFDGFGVELGHQSDDVFERGSEFFGVCGVAAGIALNVFGPHVTFRDGDVAEEIAKCEFSGGVGPIDFVGWNAASYTEGAFADVAEVVEEGLDGLDFHGEPRRFILARDGKNGGWS
jgi:hypothetical protein